MAANFRNLKDTISQPSSCDFSAKGWFHSPQNWPLAWCDRLPMALTPSFQLRIVHHLMRWITDFSSFKMTYSMHKLSSRKCSKSGWKLLSSWMLHVRFLSLLCLIAFMICLWQRTIKLQSLFQINQVCKEEDQRKNLTLKNFATPCEIFPSQKEISQSLFTLAKFSQDRRKFRNPFNSCGIFASQKKISQLLFSLAKFSQLHIWLAKSSCNL